MTQAIRHPLAAGFGTGLLLAAFFRCTDLALFRTLTQVPGLSLPPSLGLVIHLAISAVLALPFARMVRDWPRGRWSAGILFGAAASLAYYPLAGWGPMPDLWLLGHVGWGVALGLWIQPVGRRRSY